MTALLGALLIIVLFVASAVAVGFWGALVVLAFNLFV